jgi:cobalt-zinc-cadmium efflux system outer membrane protein
MTKRGILSMAAVAIAASAGVASAAPLTIDGAVATALQRNRDVIAARLEIDAATLDVVAARIYWNPQLNYNLGNLVLGEGNLNNTQGADVGFFGQPVQSIGVSEVIDIWAKRSARIRAADRGVEHRKLVVEDALREIAYAVRSAFEDVLHAQSQRQLAHEFADRYAQTVKLSQARFKAGDISEAELRKIELEGLKYQNDVIDADTELDVTRGKLAAVLGLGSPRELPADGLAEPARRPVGDPGQLVSRALASRPDLRAAGAARTLADAAVASAKREAYPDISLGAAYTHSQFTAAGDNPNTMALSLSLPLPLFDRNQANIGRAELDRRRADNDSERLRINVTREVSEAVRRNQRAVTLLASFETAAGGNVLGMPTATSDRAGMLERAETALRVAEKSYRAGALSLLEILEAQRTYLDTRGQYLKALDDFRQSEIDVTHAVGEQ